MKEKADVVHRHGARLVGQLVHLGREFIGGESDQPPMAPSHDQDGRATPTRRTSSPSRRSTTSSRAGGSPPRTSSRPVSTAWRSTRPMATCRPVHVAADQPTHRQLRRLLREPDAVPAPGDRGDAIGHARPGSPWGSGSVARRRSPAAWTSTTACGSRGPRRAGRRRLLQHHPRHAGQVREGLHRPRRRGGPVGRRGCAPPPACPPWWASGSATWAPPSTPSRPATPTWSAWPAR